MTSQIKLIEVKDGLLATPDNALIKAREAELFPAKMTKYFQDKTKISYKKIDFGLEKITVKSGDKRAMFDAGLFNYAKELGRVDCYLSNVPLANAETECYPLFVKYKYGWVAISPLEAV